MILHQLLVLSEAQSPQLPNKNDVFLAGIVSVEPSACASPAPHKWELLLLSLCLGKALLCLLSGLFPQITGRPLRSWERPGRRQSLRAGADRA